MVNKALNVKKLKAWAVANRGLALAVVKAKAFAEAERARVDAYVEPIFARYTFTNDLGEGEPLTKAKDLYLSEDDAKCTAFYAEVAVAHRAHGWTGNPEYCPALVAETLRIEAENKLLASLATLTGVDGYNTGLDIRAKALDLALGVCLVGVK